jgi:hypothetical protein
MEHDQAPRRDNPADPVTATPEEVAASTDRDQPADADPNRKADTTKDAAVEPSG